MRAKHTSSPGLSAKPLRIRGRLERFQKSKSGGVGCAYHRVIKFRVAFTLVHIYVIPE